MVKYGDWAPRDRIEIEFARAMRRALALFLPDIKNLFDPNLLALRRQDYNDAVGAAVSRMVTQLFADNNRTWRAAAREGGRGREIHEALRQEFVGAKRDAAEELVRRRFWHVASYAIKDAERLPVDLTNDLLAYVQNEAMKGRRPEAIEADVLARAPTQIARRAKMFARTITASSHTAITLTRMKDLGNEWYVWRTSDDQRVRASHEHMDGVLVWIRDPPSPEKLIGEGFQGVYHAGQTWNCRCYPEPLIELHYVQWPHKVYFQGRIKTMTRAEFQRRFGNGRSDERWVG